MMKSIQLAVLALVIFASSVQAREKNMEGEAARLYFEYSVLNTRFLDNLAIDLCQNNYYNAFIWTKMLDVRNDLQTKLETIRSNYLQQGKLHRNQVRKGDRLIAKYKNWIGRLAAEGNGFAGDSSAECQAYSFNDLSMD